MSKTVLSVVLVLCLVSLGQCKWEAGSHDYSPSTSSEVANAIKEKLLSNIGLFVDKAFAKDLESDLKEKDDSKRKVKELSDVSANQLFGILGLSDPECDKDGDGLIRGNELKCLNYAWKAYLPH